MWTGRGVKATGPLLNGQHQTMPAKIDREVPKKEKLVYNRKYIWNLFGGF